MWYQGGSSLHRSTEMNSQDRRSKIKPTLPSLNRQILASARPYMGMIIFALAQVALISGAELLRPWPLKLIIDHALGGQPLSWPPVADWSREALILAACSGLVGI